MSQESSLVCVIDFRTGQVFVNHLGWRGGACVARQLRGREAMAKIVNAKQRGNNDKTDCFVRRPDEVTRLKFAILKQ